jgi:hypothetical protein
MLPLLLEARISSRFLMRTQIVEEAPTEEAYFSLATQAPFFFHLWCLRHAGQCSDSSRSDKDSNLIFSVVSPVGTGLPRIGQRITMSGIRYSLVRNGL